MRGEDGEYLLFTGFLTSESVKEIAAYIEAAANDLPAESRRQFERLGDLRYRPQRALAGQVRVQPHGYAERFLAAQAVKPIQAV